MKNTSTTTSKIKEDAIVISGISGLFPSADSTMELSEKLFNKVDMVSSNMFPYIKHPELPHHYGKINGLTKFDSQFFRVTPNQALSFEPCGRKLMEQAYGAIFDAGVNPETLRGSKLGVFVGFSQSDNSIFVFTPALCNGFTISGCSKTMLANRISYWIDAKGPSFGIDVGCVSSMVCLEIACQRIISGECDAALVAGCSYVNHPGLSLMTKKAGFLCLDGKTKCFDKNGNGYVRSEAVNVLFLQKAKDAKRIYTEICHVKGVYTSKPDSSFLPIRDPNDIQNFLEEFYSEVEVTPDAVEYIEANVTGISEADRCEIEGTGKVFGKTHPVKIGSIKSNLGHTESASGVVSVTKACLAYQKGELPANLHYTTPFDTPVIKENKFQVVTDNTTFKRGYMAINNWSYSGANYHALLKGHFIPKDTNKYSTVIPRLVLVSGRNEEGVNNVFDILEKSPIDPEQIALINNIFKDDIPGHTGRGFAIFDSQKNTSRRIFSREFEFYPGTKRPVCFMYSGMGSQWAGMANQLMQIPIFTTTINKLHKVLEPKGLNLLDLLTNENNGIVTNIMYSLVGITAIQIGLTDILKALGVVPDIIIGHSVGEIGSAYADECFTAEQAILISYYRGCVSANTKFIKGKMAVVGLGHKKVKEISPTEIDIACHNSSESTTISGPADVVEQFIESLTEQNIFAKTVASSGIAFHSRYIANAGAELMSLTNDLIKEPKRRSKKWISTSYTPDEWDLKKSQLASAEYFTHNLLSKVCFEEGARFIPNDAIIIEIAPHGLMQSILKKSHPNCCNLPLMRRNYENNVQLFLEAVGKLYECGLNPNIEVLYPKVNYPVSTETPALSHLVQWDHSVDWKLVYKHVKSKTTALYAEFIISIFDDEYSYIGDYFRNGKNVFPESTLLVLVWKTLAMYKEVNYTDLAVKFENIKFHADVSIKSSTAIKLCISIQKASNKFEVTLEDKLIVSGIIDTFLNHNISEENEIKLNSQEWCLDEKDIYKMLNVRGYDIGRNNLLLKAANIDTTKAIIKWQNEWTYLIDTIIQLNVLSESEYTPCKIKYIANLTIDVKKHIDSLICGNNEEILYAERNTKKGVTSCGGVICESMIFSKISPNPTKIQMLSQKFIPHFCNNLVDMQTAINVNMQIVFQNSPNEKLIVKIVRSEFDVKNSNVLKDIITKICLFEIDLDVIEINDFINLNYNHKTVDVIVFTELWKNELLQNVLNKTLDENYFVMLVEENIDIDLKCHVIQNTASITCFEVEGKIIFLLKKSRDIHLFKNSIITSSLHHLKYDLQKNCEFGTIFILDNKSLINPASYKDAVKDIVRNGNLLSLLDVDEVPLLPFTKNMFLQKQIEKGLTINTLRNGEWGGYYHILLKSNFKIQHVELTTKDNNFNAFEWTEMPTEAEVNKVQVHYSGLCMQDCESILNANKRENFGMDFSGVNSKGKRVMGCVASRAMSSLVQPDPDLYWPVPEQWSLEDAATVPLPYVHAYYCLTIKHVLRSNSTVLVTGGAGALGQAVISLCLSLDCKVFTTVSSKQKKSQLMKLFPQLNEKDIGFSIDTEFRDYILLATKGNRCNLVINCNIGVIRQGTLECVAPFGYFLDLSEKDMINNDNFWMGYLNEDKSYVTVRLSSIFTEANIIDKKRLQKLIAEGIAKGIVKPLPRTVFPRSEVSRAFKIMMTRQHTGRILINMKEDCSEPNGELRLTLNSIKLYIIIWDGSEIGVEIINRLIERGAKKLLIQNTGKSESGYFRAKYLHWKQSVNIDCYDGNLNNDNGCKKLFEYGNKIAPIDGIFHISSHLEETDDTKNIYCNLILSNLDFGSRDITDLSYFASVKLVPFKIPKEDVFAESDQRFFEREKLGLPSISLTYKSKGMNFSLKTITALLDGFEKSLKHKNNNILLLDQENGNKNISEPLELRNTPNTMQFSDDKLSIFVGGVEKDECLASEPIVSMKTLTSEFNEDEIDIDPDDRKAIVISGFLGYYKTLSVATERLKMSAIGLQLSPDMDGSVCKLAENLLQYVKSRYRLKSKFYILAYSFGVNVALEMTALLEKEGYHGIIFCLDSSPLALQHQLKAYLGHLTENELQDFIIHHIYSQLTRTSSESLKQDLEKCDNWSDKNVAFISNIKHVVSVSHEYLNHLINAIYKRILLAIDYKPDLKLNSEIVLIKGLPDPKIDKLPNDYDLAQYTTKPVKIFNVTSNHVSVPNDCKISNIINGMLEPELLKLFQKKNLCEVYNS